MASRWSRGGDDDFGGYPAYVPVAERQRRAALEVARIAKKSGQAPEPVQIEGRSIARTFWGKAWCDNLESYSDYASRLPRGRSYVRNGCVVDLNVDAGKVDARVSGTRLYTVKVRIAPLASSRWRDTVRECAGSIDSLVELLQGKLSRAVMARVTRPREGLFPMPNEIEFECSCPDWAGMCKHVAAVLYGVGSRLDTAPELLFRLRGVDPIELVGAASAAPAVAKGTRAQGVKRDDMAAVFGIELDGATGAGERAVVAVEKSAKAQEGTAVKKSVKSAKGVKGAAKGVKGVAKGAVKKGAKGGTTESQSAATSARATELWRRMTELIDAEKARGKGGRGRSGR